ncbi:MAG: UDP-N-acetylmuramate dehydrogenase [Actinomycetota bacterium]|nr:UDP-N-acetylmuramate dehydrogenase [Actinomycetota bacterium]
MSLADLVSSELIRRDVATAGMTTYKFGGPAKWYTEVESQSQLERVLHERNSESDLPPVFILGRGSNVVIADAGYSGLVVKLVGDFNEILMEGAAVNAGGGVSLPRLARFCASNGRGGLEFYVGIPGSVGGAIVMNAGGHGADTAAWLIDATILDVESGRITVEDAAGLDLSYRHSRLGSDEVVLSARFRTVRRQPGEAETLMRDITGWRREHQPGGTFNAGSVFKNPAGDAAGRLIDTAGLKRLRCGGVSVSDRHANFFVADDQACAQDVYDLVQRVRSLVAEKHGVELQPEIRFIGDFGGGTT